MKTPTHRRPSGLSSDTIRQRIIETKLVPASELKRHPLNFRTHPGDQRRDVSELLTKIGQVSPLIVRRLPDGSLVLIDGHLRADIADDKLILVAITDLTEEEANIVLAMLDYTASQATINPELVKILAENTRSSSILPPIVWDGWSTAMSMQVKSQGARDLGACDDRQVQIPSQWSVIAECDNEQSQKDLFEEFTRRGIKCRLLIS